MSNLPALFSGNTKLPGFLKSSEPVTNALAAHHTEGFPVLSIKGKVWTVRKGDEKKVIPNPKDPDSPASYVEAVIIKASPVKQKVWYAKTFSEGDEAGKPDCFSADGVKPDPLAEKPQSKSCAVCKKNQWASKTNADGTPSKGKACNDVIRLAVASVSELDNPMLLRIPPASIKAAGDYGQMLAKRGVPLEAVITKLRFDPEAPTPKVLFEPVGFLSEEQYNEVKEIAASERVEAILGATPLDEAPAEAEEPADALGEVPAHLKAAGEANPTPAAASAPAASSADAAKATRPKKTATAPAAEEDEEAKLMAQLAALQAKKIQKTQEVANAEVQAAVEAGVAGTAVAGASVVGAEVLSSDSPGDVDVVVTAEIPDLSSINFDD